MRGTLKLSLGAVILVLAGGLLVTLIAKANQSQQCVECKMNLRMIGLGLTNYHDCNSRFPPGTVANSVLAIDSRLSWYVAAWSFVGDGQLGLSIHLDRAWDDEINRNPVCTEMDGTTWIMGHARGWICPANSARAGPDSPGFTHYLGVAGIGNNATTAPPGYPLIGVFGYDRQTTLSNIQNGASNTLLVIETATDNGPWTRGGPSTVRALDPSGPPYLGPHGQFSSLHRPHVTHAAFADGSVRALMDGMEPRTFDGMATIAGAEAIDDEF
jgi:hypothetical protein